MMVYMLRVKDKKGFGFLGGNTPEKFRTKKAAQKRAKFLRQMDDDLPKSKRRKFLKTIRAVKINLRRA